MNKIPPPGFAFLLIFMLIPQVVAAPEVASYDGLLHAIRETRAASQARITAAVEQEKVREAWEIGKLINEHILLHKERADYGEQVLKRLSGDLAVSETELGYIVQFFRTYPISPPAEKLSWAHYRELLSINDSKEREEVTKRAAKEHWTRDQVREEIRRRQLRTQAPVKLPEITPGPLYTYQIIRLKDRLKIDLGFGLYLDLPEKDSKKFKEGDIIRIDPSSGGLVSVIARIRPKFVGGDEAISNLFTYSAVATQVVDGDTFHALIDLGFGLTFSQRVRLRRIDAPEIVAADGKEAKAYLEKILSRDQGRIIIKSWNLDQHGRPLADVWVQGKSVDQELLDQGLAMRINE